MSMKIALVGVYHFKTVEVKLKDAAVIHDLS